MKYPTFDITKGLVQLFTDESGKRDLPGRVLQSLSAARRQKDQGLLRVRLHRREPEAPEVRDGGHGGGGRRPLADQELQAVQVRFHFLC